MESNSDTVSAVEGARLRGLLARGLIGGAAAAIAVIASLLTLPWSELGPSADERRIADLQRLSHAVEGFRARQHVLPAALARLPVDDGEAAGVRPVTRLRDEQIALVGDDDLRRAFQPAREDRDGLCARARGGEGAGGRGNEIRNSKLEIRNKFKMRK